MFLGHKTDCYTSTKYLYTMEFTHTYSREVLQEAYEKHRTLTRNRAIESAVNQSTPEIYAAAQEGKTQYVVSLISTRQVGWINKQYYPTNEDLIEGFSLKFPGCKVEYEETLEPHHKSANLMVKKVGILVDWS